MHTNGLQTEESLGCSCCPRGSHWAGTALGVTMLAASSVLLLCYNQLQIATTNLPKLSVAAGWTRL